VPMTRRDVRQYVALRQKDRPVLRQCRPHTGLTLLSLLSSHISTGTDSKPRGFLRFLRFLRTFRTFLQDVTRREVTRWPRRNVPHLFPRR
jgi:hypothetical protein